MSQEKYIGMDVHQATISAAVMDVQGKLLMECVLETRASAIVEFIRGLQGTLSLTFEEGTWAAWLHDLLKPNINRLVVCDPRKAALLKEGNKSDRIRRAQIGGDVTHQPTPFGLPRRAWHPHLERTRAQLSHPQQRCHSHGWPSL